MRLQHPLLQQQQRFALGLTGPDGAPALDLLRPLRGRAPRLDVYRHAYRARLVAALGANYPVLQRALGDEAFEALALGYLAAHPSGQPSIRWFGDALAAHVQALPEDQALHPALTDLARIEWALGLSFDAADATPLVAAELATIAPADWPALRLALHPSVQQLTLDWAVEPLWRSLNADADAPAPEPQAQRHDWLAWRSRLDTHWRSLGDDEAAQLTALAQGADLARLCQLATQWHEATQAAAQVASWLQRWVADGMLVRRVD